MKIKKIIVTGGLGFIGSNLIDLLIKNKFKVINLDKVSYSSNFYNVKNYKNSKFYKFYKVDINNKKKITKIFLKEKPIAIFNLAAETHVDRSIDGPYPFIKNNILGIYNLLEATKVYFKINKKFKLIHISTDEVFGDILRNRSNEDYPYKPSSPYAASKASSDHLVYSYFKTYNLPIIVTNCSNNYGPKQHPEKLIPKMIYNIMKNKDLPIYGKGTNSREWIYVEDHCEALLDVFKKGKIGNFYNIGSNEDLNNLKVCKKLLKIGKKIDINNKSKVKLVKDRPGHDNRYALDSNKIKKELKWKKNTNFSEGIKKTFVWYLNNLEYFKSIKKKDIITRLGQND
ncbi:dTDP-glucose 4,6-dehydratase [Candidatus Pelagibacter sp.]|jgi:dTDP-glucose 4,6-dehydratase|nr:dTDP-glucose 4,6-dehydratase [Candidatus Pelagibacter sp.]MDA9961163.1 dTDP-glucose 4,6-dehydratase [Candidatus Pelagibacter sp.]|tara:strand:- start:373 stop:1398 length:1026 start_codon:yes stop_codon:yes gene_type:complete